MRRRKWRFLELCLFCRRGVAPGERQRLRVEFEDGTYLSPVACDGCARVLDLRGELVVSCLGRCLTVEKRDQVGPHRIRGDGTWSCKGAWL